MKGHKEVVEVLNEVLAGELVAINQYFLHSRMCDNWGFKNLAHIIRAESIDEMKHADALISRILFLEGLPNLQRLDKLHIGETVPEQFKCDLDLETGAMKVLRDGIVLCREKGDRVSEELLANILESEEKHVDWLETQLGLLAKLGEKHYLAQQLHEED
ncbi:MAG: bacterioferritin [Polyangiaceae bacterium]|nr:bacterioferritin [Polyangiaceae bacterium]